MATIVGSLNCINIRSVISHLLNKNLYQADSFEIGALFYKGIVNSLHNLFWPLVFNRLLTMNSKIIVPPAEKFSESEFYTQKC